MSVRILLLLTLSLLAASALADKPAASASTSAATANVPLPEIPPMPAIERPVAKAKAIDSLETRISQLASVNLDGPVDPNADIRFLTLDLDAAVVAAIRVQLQRLKGDVDGKKARRVLRGARSAGRKAIRRLERKAKKAAKKGKTTAVPSGDWLLFLLSQRSERKRAETRAQLIQLFAMVRMLEAIASTPAVRELVNSYSYFGELVRIDVQRALERLNHKAVPALLEAKQHDARKVRRWARKQLDAMGRAIPGESVSTTDTAVLADVLRAFGRIKDLEATRVVLSYANSDRIQLRTAARQAVGAFGKPAHGFYRNAYKDLTGKKPPRSWDWKRTVQELFRLHDRARMSKVYDLMTKGLAALENGKHGEAAKLFDQVLARAPLFPERARMAPAYAGYADELVGAGDDDLAMVALRKALRLAPGNKENKALESKLAYLEGKVLAAKGTPDRFILERAIELDPSNAPAKKLLASLESEATARQTKTKRYVAAIGVAFVALCAMILLVRRREPKPETPGSASGSESGTETSSEA